MAIVLLGGIWILVTGLLARSQLNDIRSEVHELRAQISSGDLGGARTTARAIEGHAHRAAQYTSGPAWAVGANLPGGSPLQTVRTITGQLDQVSRTVLPQVVTASQRLDPSTLRRPDGSLDLAAIAAAAPALQHADAAMSAATARIRARPAHSWLPVANSARGELLTQMTTLGHAVHSAELAARIAPPMLGATGVRRYFVAFQNDAEARGTGGLPGAFAIVRADHGRLSFERFESDSALSGVHTDLDFGQDYDEIYGRGTTSSYVNSNLSPNFPYAAQTWIAMWEKKSHQTLSGALAIDPTALSYLLAVTGPATLPDHTQVGAQNVVALTQQGLYRRFPRIDEVPQRKRYLLAIAKAVSEQILESSANTTQLVQAAGHAGGQRRLLIYSTSPSVETALAQTSFSGAIPTRAAPYAGLSIVNLGGNKLDYYLDRSLSWQRAGCGAVRDVAVTIRLTNGAPSHGLPPYVTERNDFPDHPTKPGDNYLGVYYYASAGASLTSAELDGQPVTPFVGALLDKSVFVYDVELPQGQTRTLVLHLREPAGDGRPVVLRQPLVRPLHVSVDDASCN